MWFVENESAKFWLRVLTELQNRRVKDILNTCVDGLKGFPACYQRGLLTGADPALHCPHATQLHEVCAVEGVQGRGRRSQACLPIIHRGEVRRSLEREIPPYQPFLAQPLAEPEPPLQLSQGHPQGELHHQRHQVLEQCYPQSDQETEAVLDRRVRPQGGLPGHYGYVEEMDDADPELENCVEPLYDRVRGSRQRLPLARLLHRIITLCTAKK